jgi:hypothetical protein
MNKYLYVCEYSASYTSGSFVAIASHEEELNSLILARKNGLMLITDRENVLCYKLTNSGLGRISGMEKSEFIDKVSSMFSGQFLSRILETLTLTEDKYPGYSDGRVRLDWLVSFHGFEPEDGVYIVFDLPVSFLEESRVISDTYYCT